MFQPFITAIMVTGKTTERYPLAMRSIEAFYQQTYLDRRLIIINDNPDHPLLPPQHSFSAVHEIQSQKHSTLGGLRNLGVSMAELFYRGEPDNHYLMQWDDDDFSHRQRMQYQVDRTARGAASLFRWELHAHLYKRKVFVNNGSQSRANGFAGTMFWPARTQVTFPEKGKHEDTDFVLAMRKQIGVRVLNNDPTMYLRFYHGRNTWSERHIMQHKPGARACTEAEMDYFNEIYNQHYAELANAQVG